MKFVIRCWLVTMFLLMGPALSYGLGCRAVVRRNVVVVQKAVVVEKVAVVAPIVAQFVPVAVPIYSAIYAPQIYGGVPNGYSAPNGQRPAPETQPDDLTNAVRQLAVEVRGLSERVQRIEGSKPPTMPPADPPTKPIDPFNPGGAKAPNTALDRITLLVTRHCSSCHDEAKSKNFGGGLQLLGSDRKIVQLTPELLGEIIDRVTTNDPKRAMPKGKSISAADRLELISAFVQK